MRRFITLLVALVLCAGATTTNAQVTRYQGEVYIAGGYGIGNNPLRIPFAKSNCSRRNF